MVAHAEAAVKGQGWLRQSAVRGSDIQTKLVLVRSRVHGAMGCTHPLAYISLAGTPRLSWLEFHRPAHPDQRAFRMSAK
jgi:hypothetical protein